MDLQKYCIEELYIKAPITALPPAPQTQIDTNLTNHVQISKEDHKKSFRVSIQTDVNFVGLPDYIIKCKITGQFVLSEECSDQEKIKLMSHTAPFIIFGIIRDTVLNLSSKTPYFPVILPILEFTQTPTEN